MFLATGYILVVATLKAGGPSAVFHKASQVNGVIIIYSNLIIIISTDAVLIAEKNIWFVWSKKIICIVEIREDVTRQFKRTTEQTQPH